MTTHDLAKVLKQLTRLLEDSPNVRLTEARLISADSLPRASTGEIAVNLSTLASLSRIDKQQWLAFISDYKLPIDVRPRDASRDILGKLLKHLEEDAAARERLKQRTSGAAHKASPELLRALQSLLNE